MRRLFLIALALPCLGAANPRERWVEVSPPEVSHGAMALDLGSIHPGVQKGLDEALALEVADAKTVWLNSYEVRCGRSLIHQIDRRPVNPRTGKPSPSLAAVTDWARPDGAGEKRVLDIVCRHDPAGGDVISDRRAAIFVLGREPKPIPPAPKA